MLISMWGGGERNHDCFNLKLHQIFCTGLVSALFCALFDRSVKQMVSFRAPLVVLLALLAATLQGCGQTDTGSTTAASTGTTKASDSTTKAPEDKDAADADVESMVLSKLPFFTEKTHADEGLGMVGTALVSGVSSMIGALIAIAATRRRDIISPELLG